MNFSQKTNIALLRCSDNLEEGSTNICKYLKIVQKYLSSHVVGGCVSWKGRSCGMVLFEIIFSDLKNIVLWRFSDNLEEGSTNICEYFQIFQKCQHEGVKVQTL